VPVLIVAGRVVDAGRLAEICDAYGIAELELFGSAASGTAGPVSDVDLLYTLRPGRMLGWEIEDLADDLAELFGRPVDLVSKRALHARLRDRVLAEARPLYAA
jgi:predicted nucleotidyltransferase